MSISSSVGALLVELLGDGAADAGGGAGDERGLADESFHLCLMIMSRSSFATQRAKGQSSTKKMIAAAVSGVGL